MLLLSLSVEGGWKHGRPFDCVAGDTGRVSVCGRPSCWRIGADARFNFGQ